MDNLLPELINYGVKVIGVLVAIWIAFRVAARLEGLVSTSLRKRKFDEALAVFFGSLARWGLIVMAVLACLGVFGINTTSFAAVIGAAGLAIGLSFQGTLSNFAAGVMVLTFRPFTIGNYIKAAGVEGVVAEIGLFVVSIDTLDNRRLIVPNSAIIAGNIENVSHHELRRVDINVGVSYSADIGAAREALDAAAIAVEGRHADKGHQVFLKGLGGSSVDFQVRVWCSAAEYWDVWQRTIESIKKHLDEAGIEIPFPQTDIHVRDMPANAPGPKTSSPLSGLRSKIGAPTAG